MKKNIEFLELDYATVITNLDTRKVYVYLYDEIYVDVIVYGLKLATHKLKEYIELNYELEKDDYFFKIKETTENANAKHKELEITYSELVEPYVTELYNEFVKSEILELILSLITDIMSGEVLHNKLMEITMKERTKLDEMEYIETEAEYQDWYDKILEKEKIREIEDWQESITDERIESLLEYLETQCLNDYNKYEEYEEFQKELNEWQESITDQKMEGLFSKDKASKEKCPHHQYHKNYDLIDYMKEILSQTEDVNKELQIADELEKMIEVTKRLLF